MKRTIIAVLFTFALTLTASAQTQNLALSGTASATASSSYSANTPADGAIDGDRTGALWGAGGGWNDATRDVENDWLRVDLARTFAVARVVLYTTQDGTGVSTTEPSSTQTCTNYGLEDYDVEALSAGSFVVVKQVRGNTLCKVVSDFASVRTPVIRITVLKGRGHFSRIVELEIHPPRF